MLETEAKLEAQGLLSLVDHGQEVQPTLHHLQVLKGLVSPCTFKQCLLSFQSEVQVGKTYMTWPMIQWCQWRSDRSMANQDKVSCDELCWYMYGCGKNGVVPNLETS